MLTLAAIASLLEAELIDAPDPSATIQGLAPIEVAGPGMVSFIAGKRYESFLATSEALAILCGPELKGRPHKAALLVHSNPYLCFARLMQRWFHREPEWLGVSDRAAVAPDAQVAAPVTIEPFVAIGAGARIGPRVHIRSGAAIGRGVEIGEGSVIHANASIYDGCKIGRRCIIHSGAVIGADGFGFATDLRRGVHEKIPQMGIVVIEDDVEVGANTTIDRAVLGETRIGAGTKIDNLVQIAHNVSVGRGCFIVSQAGISGSTKLGNFVTLAGQVGVVGHIKIGDGVQVGAQSGVSKDIAAGQKVLGSPACPGDQARRILATYVQLPELRARLHKVEKALEQRKG